METQFHATTICAVRKNGHTAIAGDGQVTFGEHTIMKANARKVRRLYHDQILAGFAGSVADAFTLFEKFLQEIWFLFKLSRFSVFVFGDKAV